MLIPLLNYAVKPHKGVLPLMKTMLEIGDYALHEITGKLGQVVAYGHEMIDSAYLPTLTVEVVSDTGMGQKTFVEDLTSRWVPVDKEEINNN